MPVPGSVLRACAFGLGALALAGCGGGLSLTGATQEPAPAAPSLNMSGRWLFSSPGRGQCFMNFGGSPAGAVPNPEGTIAPEGGCPGKFFTSRKWTYEQGSLVMRDHNGKVLAQLSGDGSRFDGKAATGEPVALAH